MREKQWGPRRGRGEEVVRPRARKAPGEPTQEEIDERNVDHGVFREWCPHCVKGKELSYGHRGRREKEVGRMPTVSMDYMYMGDKQSREERDWDAHLDQSKMMRRK
jgi:hypothetical protein